MVDILSKNDVKRIKQIKDKLPKSKLTNLDRFLTEEEDNNIINECVYKKSGTNISNVCFFNGTNDNHLVEANFLKLDSKAFIEEATNYAINFLGAKTIVIFTDKEEEGITPSGYESIGDYNGKNTWIMDVDTTMEKEPKYETNK